MNGIKLRVYESTKDLALNKPVLSRTIPSESASLQFPFDSIVRSFKSVFGLECVVEFSVF